MWQTGCNPASALASFSKRSSSLPRQDQDERLTDLWEQLQRNQSSGRETCALQPDSGGSIIIPCEFCGVQLEEEILFHHQVWQLLLAEADWPRRAGQPAHSADSALCVFLRLSPNAWPPVSPQDQCDLRPATGRTLPPPEPPAKGDQERTDSPDPPRRRVRHQGIAAEGGKGRRASFIRWHRRVLGKERPPVSGDRHPSSVETVLQQDRGEGSACFRVRCEQGLKSLVRILSAPGFQCFGRKACSSWAIPPAPTSSWCREASGASFPG